MRRLLIVSLLLVSAVSQASDVYVRANIENISTDYASTKAGLVLKLKNSDYAGCDNKFTKFYLSDFQENSIDLDDAKERMRFSRSIALSAMMANKRVEFVLKAETGGTCTAIGWLKLLND